MASPLDQCTVLERRCLQALWDIRGILGFDNDGDKTPGATIAGMGTEAFVTMVLIDARQHEREMAQILDEYEQTIANWGTKGG